MSTSYKSPEARAARALVAATNTLTFDPVVFAYVLTHEGPEANVQTWQILVQFIKMMASNFDQGQYHDEAELEVALLCRHLLDMLEVFEATVAENGKHRRGRQDKVDTTEIPIDPSDIADTVDLGEYDRSQ